MLYKKFLIFIFSIVFINTAYCQIDCGIPWPLENSRTDTLTNYLFLDRTIPMINLPDVLVTSNFSFKTKKFNVTWMPIYTENIELFIERSLTHRTSIKILDTLQCSIQEKNHTVIVIKKEKRFSLYVYYNQNGEQDIIIVDFRKQKYIKRILQYLETYL